MLRHRHYKQPPNGESSRPWEVDREEEDTTPNLPETDISDKALARRLSGQKVPISSTSKRISR